MKNYRVTMEYFKENMTDLVDEKLRLKFDKVGTTNKSNLTRAYNKNFKTSIIRNKNKKGKAQTSVNSQNIYDENGNPLNEIAEEEDDVDESSESVIDIKGKTKTKGKSRSRSKSNDKKNGSKSKSKSKTTKNKSKSGNNKGKKKTKKKKDESEEEEYDFEDDED